VIRNRVLISGQVQGVYFRDSCRRLALRYGVTGWVRNLPDEVHRLVDWAHYGPRAATVTDVAVREERPEGLGSFVIR
jgi:acylphosphatase